MIFHILWIYTCAAAVLALPFLVVVAYMSRDENGLTLRGLIRELGKQCGPTVA